MQGTDAVQAGVHMHLVNMFTVQMDTKSAITNRQCTVHS